MEKPGDDSFFIPGFTFGRRRYLSLEERLLSPAAQENPVLRRSAAASTGGSFPHADIRIATIRWTLPYAFRPLCSRPIKAAAFWGADGMPPKRVCVCMDIREGERSEHRASLPPAFPCSAEKPDMGSGWQAAFLPATWMSLSVPAGANGRFLPEQADLRRGEGGGEALLEQQELPQLEYDFV